MDKVWYVSYGSNMDEHRFECYLNGGTAKGSDLREEGCRDSSGFSDQSWVELPHPLYFSKASTRWQGGGVLFLDDQASGVSIGKAYLVHWEQFLDITKQECGITVNQGIPVNKDQLNESGYIDIGNYWYGRIVYLGDHLGKPMYTFTVPEHLRTDVKVPSASYIERITEGLKSKGLGKSEIAVYLQSIKGYKIEE